MFDIKGSTEEDRLPLWPDAHATKFTKFPEIKTKSAIIKGVGNQLEKWPSYLVFVFLTSCIVIASLVFFVVVTVIFSLPTTTNMQNRGRSINVYSVREEDRVWSMMDLCHVESAARENPELNIHLMILRKRKFMEDRTKADAVTTQLDPETRSVSNAIDLPSKATRCLKILTREARLRDLLAHKYENVKNHDIVVETFFQGTNLSKVANNLNNETLKMATEAYLIWNSTGIALNPRYYCNLKYISQFLCKKDNKDCVPDKLATVDPKNNIQASGIPCQSFVGYFINDISKNGSISKEDALSETINKFCPKMRPCSEIRILDNVRTCPLDISKCPIVNRCLLARNVWSYRYFLPRL
ncbi:hypothetical protein KPH14_005699 [Odynerus spinipes]|uniref:Uncharacterized protein n=1 Tax=Odynerus spinipes TaxID=1348599 RepID=A0AAD9RAW5_9HYME|nr:hypothetical protein KPH14_005699 [Odynerus spinipes]